MKAAPLYGPAFSSYAADEVSWLLTDLSHLILEAPPAQREKAIQTGAAHYAESLPVEYQPTDDYVQLFHAALADSADRIATAVGVVSELVLARNHEPVLVSLARAGTPVGILMRRWIEFAHGVRPPHYTVSIVRGRGIDRVALRYLARHHDTEAVVFVDGWTGKGAICRELEAALATVAESDRLTFPFRLAVLADPGSCTDTYGTREDFLIPSACLNSTVSGLVSRTVLHDRLIPPDRFHGAKFYRDLRDADVSALFLDRVAARFPSVVDRVAVEWPKVATADRRPRWTGWASTVALCETYGLDDVNLVKPGVGETTRVLLRRVPWRVLVRPNAGPDVAHVRQLARERDVPVEAVAGLPYRCVGLIRPHGSTA
jgi:Phosphoribosyl transferase (PRTase)/PELOTA RNA binding domain